MDVAKAQTTSQLQYWKPCTPELNVPPTNCFSIMATTLHLPSDVPFTKHLPNLTWLIIAQSTFNYQKKWWKVLSTIPSSHSYSAITWSRMPSWIWLRPFYSRSHHSFGPNMDTGIPEIRQQWLHLASRHHLTEYSFKEVRKNWKQ